MARSPVRHAHVRLSPATLQARPHQRQRLMEGPNLRPERRIRKSTHRPHPHSRKTTLMKLVTLILPTFLLLALISRSTPPAISGAQPVTPIAPQDSDARPLSGE